MYLQSIHLTRQQSRLTKVKPQQSEWLTTDLFSAERGSPIEPCRVGSTELNVYPYIIPVTTAICTRQLLCARVVYNIGSVVVAPFITRAYRLAIRGMDLFVIVLLSSLVNSECVLTFSYFF